MSHGNNNTADSALRTIFLPAMALAVGLATASASGAVIRLKPVASACGIDVKLGDVADVFEPNPAIRASLESIVIAESPKMGITQQIGVGRITERLKSKGISPTDIRFAGSDVVAVTAASTSALARSSQASEARRLEWSTVVAHRIRDRVAATTGRTADLVRVHVEAGPFLDYLAEANPQQWDLIVPRWWQSGRQFVTLEVAGATTTRFRIAANITMSAPRVVAHKTMKRGQTITTSDLEAVDPTDGTEPIVATFADAIVQKEATPAISQRDVAGPILVERNARVSVQLRNPTARFEMQTIARSEGRLGDWISVQEPKSKCEMMVRVTGRNTAVLPATDSDPGRQTPILPRKFNGAAH